MTRKEAIRQANQRNTLAGLGFTLDEADALRRISMTLHRWHELECGTDGGWIERSGDDSDGPPYWMNANTGKSYRIPDRERGALKRLAVIIEARNKREWHPIMPEAVSTYVQGDPRGAALYIIRPGDVPQGARVSAYYSRGVCVY